MSHGRKLRDRFLQSCLASKRGSRRSTSCCHLKLLFRSMFKGCRMMLHSRTSCSSVRTFQVRHVNGEEVSVTTKRWSIGERRSDVCTLRSVKQIQDRFEKDYWFLSRSVFHRQLFCRDSSGNPSLGSCQWISSFPVCVHMHELLSLVITRVACLHGITWPKTGHCTYCL